MYINTLNRRAANAMNRRSGFTSFGMTGLYNPGNQTLRVLSCPEKEDLIGQTMPIEASRGNVANAATYAKNAQTEVRTAIDKMNWAAQSAKARDRDPSPQMLFFFPSVYVSNGTIYVQINPFSCRTPEFEGNTNIRYPVQGFVSVEAFVANVALNATDKRSNPYDSVSYFVCRKHPPVHEGFLNDPALGDALAQEVACNPLLPCIEGTFKPSGNKDLNNEYANESVKYQLCLRNHPEVAIFGNVCSLYDYEHKILFSSSEEILKRLTDDVCFALGNRDRNKDPELVEFVRNNIYVRCVSGFRLHDSFYDMSQRNPAHTNRRLFLPLKDRCSYLLPDDPENKDKENVKSVCMPPLKRVQSADGKQTEDKAHLFTVRSLSLLTPDGKSVTHPKGEGLVVVRSRKDKDTGEYYHYLTLQAGFLSHCAQDLTTRYSMDGTKVDLCDQGITSDKILPLLRDDPENAVRVCQELYAGLEERNIHLVEKDEDFSQSNMQEPEPEFPSEDGSEEVPF